MFQQSLEFIDEGGELIKYQNFRDVHKVSSTSGQQEQRAPWGIVSNGALSLANSKVKILSRGASDAVSTTNYSGLDPVVLWTRCCAAMDTVRERDRWISPYGSR